MHITWVESLSFIIKKEVHNHLHSTYKIYNINRGRELDKSFNYKHDLQSTKIPIVSHSTPQFLTQTKLNLKRAFTPFVHRF